MGITVVVAIVAVNQSGELVSKNRDILGNCLVFVLSWGARLSGTFLIGRGRSHLHLPEIHLVLFLLNLHSISLDLPRQPRNLVHTIRL